MLAKVLIVDDEDDFRTLLVNRLNRKDYSATGCSSGEQAMEEMTHSIYHLAVIDLKMPGMDGLELLRLIKEKHPEMEVILLTGHGSTESAVEAMKLGAYDYLTKPVNLKELQVLLDKALEKVDLKRQNISLKIALEGSRNNKRKLIGISSAMAKLRSLIKKVADSSSPVLIEGESGTGKELVSKALHYESSRTDTPFIVVNCGALPEHLMESELFGHVKGAFTGALETKTGLVELADRGTLFFDEIGEMPLGLQTKLLRFMESGEFRRVGDNSLRWVQTRILAATNRNLAHEIEKGNFREDLFYRLNVVKITVPSLRERKEDIPLLADFFLSQKAPKMKLSREAITALKKYDFPGNVRELANLIERGCLLAEGAVIFPEDMFACVEKKQQTTSMTLAEIEKEHIKRILDLTSWNKTKAAETLDISLRNLYRKIETYDLNPE